MQFQKCRCAKICLSAHAASGGRIISFFRMLVSSKKRNLSLAFARFVRRAQPSSASDCKHINIAWANGVLISSTLTSSCRYRPSRCPKAYPKIARSILQRLILRESTFRETTQRRSIILQTTFNASSSCWCKMCRTWQRSCVQHQSLPSRMTNYTNALESRVFSLVMLSREL